MRQIKRKLGFEDMFKNISDIIIWSGNYEKLIEWYMDKLGLEKIGEVNHPEDTCTGFRIGNVELWIGKHDKVNGKNKDHHRIMFNLVVDSVSQTYNTMRNRGIKFYAKPFKAPTFDKYFATFFDLDDNMIQLIGGK